jgi:predicted dithiol-disulfide oxidoreductase (DUF899 family)
LIKEKELTRLHDAISAERRALPWVTIEKEYVFDAPEGREPHGRPLIQEDSGKQIGQAIATWLDTLA